MAQLDFHRARKTLRVIAASPWMSWNSGGSDLSKDPKFPEGRRAPQVYYGAGLFPPGVEPYLTIAGPGTRKDAGGSHSGGQSEVIWDVVSQIKVGGARVTPMLSGRGKGTHDRAFRYQPGAAPAQKTGMV